MTRVLDIRKMKNPYHEIAVALEPHKDKPTHSEEFWVEVDNGKPVVSILYPGYKVQQRTGKRVRYKWANLYDFLVVPHSRGKKLNPANFTFERMLEDFYNYKRDNVEFWSLLKEIYETNELSRNPPILQGIDPKLYLLTTKWIWIQEDLRYKLRWDDIDSPIKYICLNSRGNSTRRGAGRAKFFGSLILVKEYFSLDEVKKIIPLYG